MRIYGNRLAMTFLVFTLFSCDNAGGDVTVIVHSGPNTEKTEVVIPRQYLKQSPVRDGARVVKLYIAINDPKTMSRIEEAVRSAGLEATNYSEIVTTITSGDDAHARDSWDTIKRSNNAVFVEEIDGFQVFQRETKSDTQNLFSRYLVPLTDYNNLVYLKCPPDGVGNPNRIQCEARMSIEGNFNLRFFVQYKDLAALPEISSVIQKVAKSFIQNDDVG